MQDIRDEIDNLIWCELGIGLYSIHLVNLSIATNTWVKLPGAVVKAQSYQGSSKQTARMAVW
jgi:hypothetical protein